MDLFRLTAFVTAFHVQLEFTLSDGKTFTYGGSGGDPFTVDKRFESDVCLGFNYRAGDYLNAIQVRLEAGAGAVNCS